jgi:putative redox protein
MPPTTIIDNADDIKEIMAGAIAQAEGGKGTKAVHRASVRLDRGLTVEASARGFRLVVDEPESFGGANAGPNPEEVVLAGVGACQAITAALYAGLMGIPITRYDVDVRGYLDLRGFYGLAEPEEELTGFTRVVCETRLEADAPQHELERFQRLVEERCVGHGTLRQPVEIESHWQITSTSR